MFVPMRLFALEFIRQSLNVDQVHFVPMKKGHMYKLPMIVGPFIVNMRHTFDEVTKMLDEMHMLLGERWAYDPHNVISNRIIENGYLAFIHESRPDLEKIASKGVIISAGANIQTPIISEK